MIGKRRRQEEEKSDKHVEDAQDASPTKKSLETKVHLQNQESGASIEKLPAGKELAHCDKQVRDRAVDQLEVFLKSGQTLSALESDTLWKAIFYCFYMSDKPLVQQALAEKLAGLMLVVKNDKKGSGTHAGLAFFDGFWKTLEREWSKLDRHRIDKYYDWTRRVLSMELSVIRKGNYSQKDIEQFQSSLGGQGRPLDPNNTQCPAGLSLFLIENVQTGMEFNSKELLILDPFIRLGLKSGIKVKRDRVFALIETILKSLEDSEKQILVSHLYKSLEADILDSTRRKMYEIVRKYGEEAR